MIERHSKAEVFSRLETSPALVAQATASTGQRMELYEYQPLEQPEGQETFAVLTFADGKLEAFGFRSRNTSWLNKLLPNASFDDPYGPERVRDCVEALEASAFTETSESGRSC